ncbi:ATP4 ATP synthase subunit 4 [Candida maltosa Xu316]|uniref:ATP synthase subunit 4 n=1 Tax=Candida maltosa (strain Xu316) TaxID=1245528 RepID=M3K6G1_CANMX|nr:ATP synthase subunit, mitochondrial, putative [Candida maltosa Xu316]
MSMINRVALRSVRPTMGMAFRPAPIGLRYLSTPVDPKQKANSIIDALPGNNYISKTGILATAAAASIYTISNGLFIIHDETVLVLTFSIFSGLVAKFVAPLYTEWADGEIKKVNTLLNESRNNHIEAVNKRIESVSDLKNVVETTKDLFALSKETAQFEAETFQIKQQLAVSHEAKSVLDSWVRFEQQQRQLEQEQLAKEVIDKVNKEIENPKFQEKVLAESLGEIEKIFAKN